MTEDDRERRHPIWRIVRIIIGIALVPIGIVGLFVPVLQGLFLLLLAFTLLASEIPFFAELREKVKKRYPRIFGEGR